MLQSARRGISVHAEFVVMQIRLARLRAAANWRPAHEHLRRNADLGRLDGKWHPKHLASLSHDRI